LPGNADYLEKIVNKRLIVE